MADLPITVLSNLGNVYSVDGGERAGILEFDLLVSESHSRSNTVTSHPVENGGTITDHIKNELEQGTLNGLVSSHSIRLRTFNDIGDLLEDTFGFVDAEQRAFDTLEAIWKARIPVTITTLMKVYDNVAITNISVNKSESDGKSITFSIGFRQLKTVSLKRIEIEADVEVGELDNDLSKQAAPPENAGRQ